MAVRTYITETEFAKIDNPQSATTYIVLDDNDLTLVKKVVFKTNNINNEGEVYIVQDEFPTPSGAIDITANANNIDVKQYATANVNVPNPSTGTLNITANDDYDVTEYAGVSVNVPNPSTGTLVITSNDTYDVTNYASAEVDVPQPSGKITITANATDIDIAQYATADVNVAAPGPVEKTCSFKFNSDGSFQFNKSGYGSYYLKVNDGEWTEYTGSQTVNVINGDVIEFKSDVKQTSGTPVIKFSDYPSGAAGAVSWELEGDLIGALYGDTFPNYGGYQMFKDCTGLTKVPNDMFANYGYIPTGGCQEMFIGCTSLTAAPALPATTLTENCYNATFSGCTSLTAAPALPATTLAISCYKYMFENCTSLTTAPELPATTLVMYCYQYMFSGCTQLNYVKCLASLVFESHLRNWLSGVAATGTFVKSALASYSTGASGIPSGWTIENA